MIKSKIPYGIGHDIRQTSLTAYEDINADGTLGDQARTIMKTLRNHNSGLTRNEISRYSGIKINAVCGRVKELLKLNFVEEIGKKKDKFTNKNNLVISAK